MTHTFIIHIDTGDMEYHAEFDAQKIAETLLDAAAREAKAQGNDVADVTVKYIGSI